MAGELNQACRGRDPSAGRELKVPMIDHMIISLPMSVLPSTLTVNSYQMKFEYQLARKDLGQFNAYYYWKNKTASAILGAIIMTGIAFMLISSRKKLHIEAAVVCMAIGIPIYFLLLHLQLKKYGDYFKEDGPMLAKKEVELTDQYYISTDMFGETKVKWCAFSKMETGKHAVYLFMETPMAIIIPKTIFENEARLAEFTSYVTERIKANNLGLSF